MESSLSKKKSSMNFMSTILMFTLGRDQHLQMYIKQLIRSRKCSYLPGQIKVAKFLRITSAKTSNLLQSSLQESRIEFRDSKLQTNQKSRVHNNLHDIMSFAISNAPACSDKEAEPSVPIHLCDGHFPSNHHGCVGTTIKGFLQVATSKKQATQHELFQKVWFLVVTMFHHKHMYTSHRRQKNMVPTCSNPSS